MSLVDYLPYSDFNVREQTNRLFSRKMLGAVLVGKFVGDYVAILFRRLAGVDLGYITGTLLFIAIFIYWEKIERRIQQEKNKLSESQKQLGDYTAEE